MTARHRYSDAYLRHWGTVFTANRAVCAWYESRGLGAIAFLSFLSHPEEILHAIVYGLPVPLPETEAFYPLLPAQDDVRLRLILSEITLCADPIASGLVAA
jgi:hypothetical protein